MKFLVIAFLLGTILSCRSSGGVYDLETVGHQHFKFLFQQTLERKAEMDELREIQCPCVAESGIDVDRYTADLNDSYAREEYEKARAILFDLHREIASYDRSMTEARCHWTVSSEKFEPPDNPQDCPADE